MRQISAALARCATMAVVALVLSGAGGWRSASVLRAQEPAARGYLVIPFDNVNREPRVYWLGEGSAVLLTDDLLALGASAITRDDRLRAFESLSIPPVASLSHATVIRLGQLVGASHVVTGAFELKDSTLTVRARAIRLDTGRMLPEMAESGPLAQMFEIYGRIARKLVPDATVSLEEMERAHPPLAAFEPYVKGVLAEAPATKLGYLEDALEAYPNFERARLAQWEVYTARAGRRSQRTRQSPARARGAVSRRRLPHQPETARRCVPDAGGVEPRKGRSCRAEQHGHRAAAAQAGHGPGLAGLVLQRSVEARSRRPRLLLQSWLRVLPERRREGGLVLAA
jgi:TolB-like protein